MEPEVPIHRSYSAVTVGNAGSGVGNMCCISATQRISVSDGALPGGHDRNGGSGAGWLTRRLDKEIRWRLRRRAKAKRVVLMGAGTLAQFRATCGRRCSGFL